MLVGQITCSLLITSHENISLGRPWQEGKLKVSCKDPATVGHSALHNPPKKWHSQLNKPVCINSVILYIISVSCSLLNEFGWFMWLSYYQEQGQKSVCILYWITLWFHSGFCSSPPILDYDWMQAQWCYLEFFGNSSTPVLSRNVRLKSPWISRTLKETR